MNQKWKYIIANWINCYFYKNDNKNEVLVNYESLLNIISHLRENFNLDESKSSIFGGRSLEEFISEKYPSFRFENGTVEVTNDEEIYIAASLLLFFVCVNSKDVDIKSAMCSKLSTSDQEVILKYSKSLMECNSISAHDVIAAITEACGPDMATGEGACSGRVMVAETPPALRSLHSEVRRLQAALDAERFDKNYLQDELTRTNLKLEKLLRDKEQYKADIMDLKAKISMCCGQEAETRGDESKSNEIVKLRKQLQHMEQRVVDVQEQLEVAEHERNTYKTKLEDLKGECDRLLVLSQEEASRAGQLADELEMEKRQSQTLRELVIELRQHNLRNGLDTSLLECDDPDTSVQSLQRSFSVCSEVCANVVEVQLVEERAKCLALKQQIQSLQDEMRDLVQKSDVMQKIITDRENDIFNLKHRINEEIEEKNNLKSYFDHEVTKLNNIVNELEQKLKDNSKHSSSVLQNKMQEIKTLQEEKLSLLQSLSDETTKSENIIKELKTEIDSEKTSKMKIREDYENLVMKMKEKVLNRNNELFELQNNVSEKSELIQQLNRQLRDEKEHSEKTINKHNKDIELLNVQKSNIEKDYNVKIQELAILRDTINEWNSKKEIADTTLRKENKAIQEKLLELTNNNSKLIEELKQKVLIITKLDNKLMNFEKIIITIEADKVSNQKLLAEFDSKNNELHERNKVLEDERNELTAEKNQFEFEISVLYRDLQELNNKLISLKQENSELAGVINKNQLDITQLQQQIDKERNNKKELIQSFENETLKCTSVYNLLQEKYSTTVEELEKQNKELVKYQEISHNNNNVIKDLERANTESNELLTGLKKENEILKNENDCLIEDKNNNLIKINQLEEDVKVLRCVELPKLKEDNIHMTNIIQENKIVIANLEKCIENEKAENGTLHQSSDSQKVNLTNKINLLEESLNNAERNLEERNLEVNNLEKIIDSLKSEAELREEELKLNNEKLIQTNNEKDVKLHELTQKLEKQTALVLQNQKEIETKKFTICELKEKVNVMEDVMRELKVTKKENEQFIQNLRSKEEVIVNLEKSIANEKEENDKFRQSSSAKINILEENLRKAERTLEERNLEVNKVQKDIEVLKSEAKVYEEDLKLNNAKLIQINEEKDVKLQELTQELEKRNAAVLQNHKEIESKELMICELKEKVAIIADVMKELEVVRKENEQFVENLKVKEQVIANLEKGIVKEKKESNKLRQYGDSQKMNLVNKINFHEENLSNAERILEERNLEVNKLQKEIEVLRSEAKVCEEDLKLNNAKLMQINEEKDVKLQELTQELEKQRAALLQNQKEIENKEFTICELNEKVSVIENLTRELEVMKKENELFIENVRSKEQVIANLEESIVNEKEESNKLRQSSNSQKINLTNQIDILEEKLDKMERILEERILEVNESKEVIEVLTSEAKVCEEELKLNNAKLIQINEEKDVKLQELTQELEKRNAAVLQTQNEIESRELMICELKERVSEIADVTKELEVIRKENKQFVESLKRNEQVIANLEKCKEDEKAESNKLRESSDSQKIYLTNKINLLEDNLSKSEHTLEERILEVNELKKVIEILTSEAKVCEEDLKRNNAKLIQMNEDKDVKLLELTQELEKHSATLLQNQTEIENKELMICELKERVETMTHVLEGIKKENEQYIENLRSKEQVIANMEKSIINEKEEKINLINKINLLEENVNKAEFSLEERDLEVNELKKVIEVIKSEAKVCEEDSKLNNAKLIQINEEKEAKLLELTQELEIQRAAVLENQEEIKIKELTICELKEKVSVIEDITKELEVIKKENQLFVENLKSKEQECVLLQSESDEWKIKKDALECEKNVLQEALTLQIENNHKLEKYGQSQFEMATELKEKLQTQNVTISSLQSEKSVQEKVHKDLENEIVLLKEEKDAIDNEKNVLISKTNDMLTKLNELQNELDFIKNNKVTQLMEENLRLTNIVEQNKTMIPTLEKLIKKELEQNELLRKENSAEKLELIQKYNTLQEDKKRLEQELNQRNIVINDLRNEIAKLKCEFAIKEQHLKEVNENLTHAIEEKEELIGKINDELSKEIALNDQRRQEMESRENDIRELQNVLKEDKNAMIKVLMNEHKMLSKHIAKIESNAALENFPTRENDGRPDKNQDVLHPQVDSISSRNISNISMDSNKTIRDLEKILNDKNRTITSLQFDITFLKSLMAESENKVLDLSKDLEASQENCQQLSNQLKKILHQKNEEIAELKCKISKVSAMENRASQIIKLSAKYQEIIQRRMAEIKSNTVLKELTNFGNNANCESDLKRSLNSGTITMEDLENFLETTERHIRRCSEKRVALQKERDRLVEVNRINESEIISVRKFLTELSVSVKTFNSVKEIYTQRLSRVVSLQRTVRRDILSVEGRLTDAAVCKLERGYAAAMQDLAECAMNLERWVERSIGRAISAEKIRQAFTSDNERASLASATFQNSSLEAQMEQLEHSFQKLLEEAVRAQKGDGARDALSLTVQEVRAEYEEKLARMKGKMKEIYQKEVQGFKEAQREEVTRLQQKLQSTEETLTQTRKDYEKEIRSLTLELWTLGEKFLDKTDEAEWLRKQKSESLMSLQHVPSSGFCTQPEEPGRSSDTHSLRSLPVNMNKKREGRGLQMSDEEGEVFDNRFLRELSPPRAPRLSELRWRNSLCPPHLKSSYPAETHLAPGTLHEDDIKAGPTNASLGGRQQRKEVGITAYKKPGPPTPSKQAGRLSATDSELRESLRVEAEPQPRKTTTPSRLRSLFSSGRNDTVEGTPRRRLSNLFRRK